MTPTNVLDAAQQTAVNALLTKVFTAVINFIYSTISSILDFVTQPTILGALVVLAIVGIGYGWFKRKRIA